MKLKKKKEQRPNMTHPKEEAKNNEWIGTKHVAIKKKKFSDAFYPFADYHITKNIFWTQSFIEVLLIS